MATKTKQTTATAHVGVSSRDTALVVEDILVLLVASSSPFYQNNGTTLQKLTKKQNRKDWLEVDSMSNK
jgi:hypothetical protein